MDFKGTHMFIMTPHLAEIGLVCNNTSLFIDHMILLSHACEVSYSPLPHLSCSKEWDGVISCHQSLNRSPQKFKVFKEEEISITNVHNSFIGVIELFSAGMYCK